ncbi:uncharacterized protein LOC129968224 [Argiope bruennichi]|uniref:uncharacterized protein LOC129968224 n=1 Tax=Argiope bruennichi TaxID=94029 RepID=UPI0024943331|nr:uncharacterized protein LOC129968224 [Argiope bruennichi]
MTNIASFPVTVRAHSTLNFSKGVISCGELFHTPVAQITKDLESQGVTHVPRITIRKDGQLLETKHLILTFHSSKIPEYIKAGYMKLAVRPYIPNPLRCFKCQRFGHSKASCRGSLTCARCAETGHENSDCNAPEKCFNCKGSHTSFSRSCPSWILEKEVIAEKVKKGISYPEAKRMVKARRPVDGSIYSNAAKKTLETRGTQIMPIIMHVDNNPFQPSYAPSEICPKSESFIKDFSPSIPMEDTTQDIPQCKVSDTSQNLASFKTVINRKKYKKNSKPKDNKTMTKNMTNRNTDSDIESDNAIEYNPNETIDETPPAPESSIVSTTVDKTVFKQSPQDCQVQWIDLKNFHYLNPLCLSNLEILPNVGKGVGTNANSGNPPTFGILEEVHQLASLPRGEVQRLSLL